MVVEEEDDEELEVASLSVPKCKDQPCLEAYGMVARKRMMKKTKKEKKMTNKMSSCGAVSSTPLTRRRRRS